MDRPANEHFLTNPSIGKLRASWRLTISFLSSLPSLKHVLVERSRRWEHGKNRGFVQAMVQAALQEATGIDFGRVWENFGEGFGKFWEDVGKHLGRLLVVLGGLESN